MGMARTSRVRSRRVWGLALAGLLVALVVPINMASAAPGVPATVTVAVAPKCIKANHTSTSTATATVKDSTGAGVSGQTVQFSTNGDVTFGTVTDHLDGTYTATITSSLTADVETISATAGTGPGAKSGSAPLTEFNIAGAASVTLAPIVPNTVRAGSANTVTATATVTDSGGRCVSGDAVTFTLSPAGPVAGNTTDHGDGTYSASIIPSATAGTETVTAHDGALNSGTQTYTQFGPASTVTIAPATPSVTADGASKVPLTATVKDSGGRFVTDDTVLFTTSGDATFDPVVNNHDGTYSTNVIASTTADTETITAHAETATGTATLTENPGPAATVALVLNPTSIPADGASHSTATATVKDAHNNLVKNETVTFSTNGDVGIVASGTNHNDGTYTSQITASTTADNETMTMKLRG